MIHPNNSKCPYVTLIMKTSWIPLLLAALLSATFASAEVMKLTNLFGNTIEAELVELREDGESEILVMKRAADQRTFELPLSELVEEDQQAVRAWWQKARKERQKLTADASLIIEFKTNRHRSKDDKGPRRDVEEISYEPEAIITNKNLTGQSFQAQVTLVCFGERQNRDSNYTVLSKTTKDVALPLNKAVEIVGESYEFRNVERERIDTEVGYEDAGYIIIIQNEAGEITHTKSSNPAFVENAETILGGRTGQFFSADFSESGNTRNNRFRR